ncbi:aldehyde dehydrogenase family protein [Evansella halocellulosilytica]|uniref:aldehyde dehydrogenase family protein n=1 Tax=Evansella halocellulosilytica TaxID=2011013 RepID=UPI000BB8A4A7|nr:aldehyde dehydrogenase family protein [Evansella halocellulosilytica]
MKKKIFLAGNWIETEQYEDLRSPYNQETIAEIPLASIKEVDDALHAAVLTKKHLKKMPAYQRADILDNVAKLIEENRERCARTIANEAAKPIQAARGEVARSIMTYKFASEEARRLPNEFINMDAAPGGENRTAYTIHEPAGVVAAITPFNFPMNLVAHKLGPAIAAGNPVILKPASQTPLSAFLIAELFEKAGLPKGALSVLTGKGSVIGETLVTDPRTNVITFTGSPKVGIQLKNKAGLKKVTLELGSNSALIIDENVNVDDIIDQIMTGSFVYQGQVCISLQRIYVHEHLKESLLLKMKEQVQSLKIGDPLDEQTNVSSLISPTDKDRVLTWIEEAITNGAKLISGGKAQQNIVEPTILADVPANVKVSCEEVFGPVVIVNSFSTWEEAIELVNDSEFGLQAGVFTQDLRKAFIASEELEVGGVMINDIPTFRVDHMPYGGVKNSGFGREGIKYAVQEMTEKKLVSFKR